METSIRPLSRSSKVTNLAEDYRKRKEEISTEDDIPERIKRTWFECICCCRRSGNRILPKRRRSEHSNP